MANSKPSIFHHGGQAGAAVIALLSCALAIFSCNSAATTAGPGKMAAKIASLTQVALGSAPLPPIAGAWHHWQKLLNRDAIGRLYQLGRFYRSPGQVHCVYLVVIVNCHQAGTTRQFQTSAAIGLRYCVSWVPLHIRNFLRCHSLLPPPLV